LAYAAAQPFIPAIRIPPRDVIFSMSRKPFSGMKIIGTPAGPKNLEFENGKFANGRITLNVSVGTSSWMVGSSVLYDVYIADLAFYCTSGKCQFWHQPIDTAPGLYACQFHSLTHFGFQHVFGQPTNKAAMTQVYLTGHWTTLGFTDTQYTIGGSDNYFWVGGYLNIGGPVGGAGKQQIIFDGVSKTDVGKVYITAANGWRGIHILGSNTSGTLNFFGGEFEGQNAHTPCEGNTIRVEGGSAAFWGTWFAYGMAMPLSSEHGVFEVTGGNVLIDRPTYDRGESSSNVPAIYQSGGVLEVRSAYGLQGTPGVKSVGGTLTHDSSVNILT